MCWVQTTQTLRHTSFSLFPSAVLGIFDLTKEIHNQNTILQRDPERFGGEKKKRIDEIKHL